MKCEFFSMSADPFVSPSRVTTFCNTHGYQVPFILANNRCPFGIIEDELQTLRTELHNLRWKIESNR